MKRIKQHYALYKLSKTGARLIVSIGDNPIREKTRQQLAKGARAIVIDEYLVMQYGYKPCQRIEK